MMQTAESHCVPDILYWNIYLTDNERTAFLHAGYDEQRDFVSADLQLHKHCIVLPFLLDFPGKQLEDIEDARVTAHAKGPLGVISIPGCAYIGWLEDVVPEPSSPDFKDYVSIDGVNCQYILSSEQRSATKVATTEEMYYRAVAMWTKPKPAARVYYGTILAHLKKSLQASRSLVNVRDKQSKLRKNVIEGEEISEVDTLHDDEL